MSTDASMDKPSPSTRTVLIAVQVSMTATALLIVALRLISRYMILKSPGWDDYATTAAMILAIIQAPLVLSCLSHGAGVHYSDLQPTEALYVMKVIYVTRVTYLLITTAIKSSVLLFYLRLSPFPTFRTWVMAAMVACSIEGVLFISMALFQCTPVGRVWNFEIPGHCINTLGFFRAETIFNLVTNVVILLLPMPMVWHLQMALRRKLLLIGIFATGAIPCGSLIARLINIHNGELTFAPGRLDPTSMVVSLQNWEAVEYCSFLICASLIHLTPLAKIIAARVLGPIHPTSPPRGISECRSPTYLLDAGASSRHDAIGTERHGFSVVSTFYLVKGVKPKATFRGGIDVGTDVPGRVSYKGLLQNPQKAFLRGWKPL
ncbi:hypothetical protein JMJ35_003071 [Cladonia borealis]|uniref:Rhodopsin domain-containing protein n=1 Tax=Cladonia borealis TaxID=184061 RepID=A0AA39V6L8_9LECA|nr:hypothetical protein JMJ35_003071 [Cladonia borealis]